MFKNFSPNMLKTFEQCPKKFHFRYVKNISMPIDDTIFETGKNIHALASYYLRKEDITKMETALSPKEKELWEYLKGIKYFSFKGINTEYNLSAKIGSHFFGGRLDALVKNEDRYYILDYKTGGAPKNAKYDYQTMIYLLATRAFFKTENICFVYIDLRHKDETIIELTEELIKEYETRLINISEKIDKDEYIPKHDTCPCEYDVLCY